MLKILGLAALGWFLMAVFGPVGLAIGVGFVFAYSLDL